MTNINTKLLEISRHLQALTAPEFSEQVQKAAEKNDTNALIKVCKKAKVPSDCIGNVVSTILSVSPQKWPESF